MLGQHYLVVEPALRLLELRLLRLPQVQRRAVQGKA